MPISRTPSGRAWTVSLSLSRRVSRRTAVAGGVAAAVAAGVGVVAKTDEGVARSLAFNAVAMPWLVTYRVWDWRLRNATQDERDVKFGELHREAAPVGLALAKKMGGIYVKFGQVVSGMDGVIPKEFTEAFKVLQDRLDPRPFDDIKAQLEREYGRPLRDVFVEFDETPLGTASIGQVHRARLRENNCEVAVKVIHPQMNRTFKADFATARFFTRLAQPEQLPWLDEVEKVCRNEFDYRAEAANLEEMANNIAAKPELRNVVVVPRPFKEWCTASVLVMDYIPGKSLHRTLKDQLAKMAAAKNVSVREIEEDFKRAMTESAASSASLSVTNSTTSRKPSSVAIRAFGAALWARDVVRNGVALAYNATVASWAGNPIPYEWTDAPLDPNLVLPRLYAATGSTIFLDHAFNADAHPGNVLSVGSNRIGLIDLGQLKHVDDATVVLFARLIVELAKDDSTPASNKRIADAWRACGFRTKHNNDELTADVARYFFDRHTPDVADKYGGVALALERMGQTDPFVHQPPEFVLLMRASFLMRLNAAVLGCTSGQYASVAKMWRPYAEKALARAAAAAAATEAKGTSLLSI